TPTSDQEASAGQLTEQLIHGIARFVGVGRVKHENPAAGHLPKSSDDILFADIELARGLFAIVKIEQRWGVERCELGVELRWRGSGNQECHVALVLKVKHPDDLDRKSRLAEAALAVNDLRL